MQRTVLAFLVPNLSHLFPFWPPLRGLFYAKVAMPGNSRRTIGSSGLVLGQELRLASLLLVDSQRGLFLLPP